MAWILLIYVFMGAYFELTLTYVLVTIKLLGNNQLTN